MLSQSGKVFNFRLARVSKADRIGSNLMGETKGLLEGAYRVSVANSTQDANIGNANNLFLQQFLASITDWNRLSIHLTMWKWYLRD